MVKGKTRGKGQQPAKAAKAAPASAPSKPAGSGKARAKPSALPEDLREDADGVFDSDSGSLGGREDVGEDSADGEEAVLDLDGDDDSDADSDADLEAGGQLSKGADWASADAAQCWRIAIGSLLLLRARMRMKVVLGSAAARMWSRMA